MPEDITTRWLKMENKNELLLAIKEAKKNLREGIDFRVADMLAAFEGIAPFLDRETVMNMKCRGCDSYAESFFPLSNDFHAVETEEYCHCKKLSHKNLSLLKIVACESYSQEGQAELLKMANTVLEEDLKPAFAERKLYDRNSFANYSVDFRIKSKAGRVCIGLGHSRKGQFEEGGIRLYLLRRLDPGFGPEPSEKISSAIVEERLMIVVEAGVQTRRMLDIDYVLEWIAQKRKMDIVYL